MADSCADPEIALFCMMPDGYTTELARDFIADAARAWSEDGWLHLALSIAGSDRPVGAVGALRVLHPTADAGSGTAPVPQPARADAGDRPAPAPGECDPGDVPGVSPGSAGLDDLPEPGPGSADLGYWVAPGHRGRGLGRAGVALITDWAFETLRLRRLAIGTMVANTASRRLARSLGYRPEALLRSYRPMGGLLRTDCVVYSLLLEEWAALREAGGGEGRPPGLPPDDALLPALAAARSDYPGVSPALPPEPPPLGDGTIALRPYAHADLPDLVSACNDPETQRWLSMLPSPYTEDHARAFLTRAAAGWQTRNEAFFCIADAASGRLLGGVGLHAGESWAGVAEIGYHVAPWARRRGVATAAARLVAQWGLDVLGLARVQILADTRNAGSCGVAAALGFTREGARRCDHGRPGDVGDHAVFSLLLSDPRPW